MPAADARPGSSGAGTPPTVDMDDPTAYVVIDGALLAEALWKDDE